MFRKTKDLLRNAPRCYSSEDVVYIERIYSMAKLSGWDFESFDEKGIRFSRKEPLFDKETRNKKEEDVVRNHLSKKDNHFIIDIINITTALVKAWGILRRKRVNLFFSQKELKLRKVDTGNEKLFKLLRKKEHLWK